MKYCKRCIMPDTRPDQIFDENGICNACKSYDVNQKINWEGRKKELLDIVCYAKSFNSRWNCVIPSSGGKDSTYQAIRARELGLNPVLVTATTCDLSEVGKKNIDNLKSLGFDTVEISNSEITRSRLNKISLETIGDIAWPEHVSIFTAPIKFALNYKIPFILWGENPQIEYGGPSKSLNNSILDRSWLEEFGGLIGLRVNDFVENYGFNKSELEIYNYPSGEELGNFKIKSVFLGYYEKWDSIRNYDVSKKNGFLKYDKKLENCYFDFEKIDNHQHGIHDYFKFLKFGFGRATDIACTHIRRGRLSREDGMEVAMNLDGKFPWEYLGERIESTLAPLNITLDEFHKTCDRFTNKRIFRKDVDGELIRTSDHSLIKINYDNQ